ncbi:hypothetical protein HL653_05160 [Sphingomonas sp. AP4-R1]|uniref:hypothetical protein n=1 Tax=Sphingomonas sp. AP4-R1 TaxID=2735134 RepID=UPI0014935224|nr:hypothetical protein [Sphingomonas sp. AP4-R1]QJU57264.1 hypothetical protein HL653_05160 [Sphingomonas sp. AP4-R1]
MIERSGIDRRAAMRLGVCGVAAALTDCRGAAAPAAHPEIPTQQLGVVTGNDAKLMADWRRWLGRTEDHDLLYFNQESWQRLADSIEFIPDLGRHAIADGRRVHWSVPVGGKDAYADVAAGKQDALYTRIARAIRALYPERAGRICVRLPWEFNLESQTLAARDAAGQWNAAAYVAAYRRIATLFRRASPLFYFDWCPNIGRGGIDPESCYPGDDVVDVVSLDVYYQALYDDQGHNDAGLGIFYYRKSQPFGLDWLAGFGRKHGKLIGLSEWGVDDDRATAFMRLMTQWIAAQGPRLSHHNYWDRTDGGINARLSDGHLPAIGNVYREAFGPKAKSA